MINFTKNYRKVSGEVGRTILDVVLEPGIDIPNLCHQSPASPFRSLSQDLGHHEDPDENRCNSFASVELGRDPLKRHPNTCLII